MHFTVKQKKVQGRHHIQISATPKTPEARALLQQFQAGVSELEKKWKAHKASLAKAGGKTAKKAGKKVSKKSSKKA